MVTFVPLSLQKWFLLALQKGFLFNHTMTQADGQEKLSCDFTETILTILVECEDLDVRH